MKDEGTEVKDVGGKMLRKTEVVKRRLNKHFKNETSVKSDAAILMCVC